MVSVMKVLSTLGRFKLLFVHMRLSVGEPRMGAMFCVSSAGDRHASKKKKGTRHRMMPNIMTSPMMSSIIIAEPNLSLPRQKTEKGRAENGQRNENKMTFVLVVNT